MDIPKDHQKYLDMDFHMDRAFELELTKQDIYNLEIYGCWLAALERGDIKPYTPDQSDFLNVLSGKTFPKNKVQKSWLAYKELRRKGITCRHCSGKGYYTNPLGGDRLTCSVCNGVGKQGVLKGKIGVGGSY